MSIAYNFPRDTFLGFDNIFNTLEQFNTVTPKSQGYPPYNVVKKDDTHFVIEIAVAGFSKDDISLTLEKGELSIKGEKNSVDENEYLHRGISARAFTRRFTIADTIQVVGADIVDGLLLVILENHIPEEDKPKTIRLGELSVKAKQLLLG
jgi:molecular chaperone IbpA